MGVIIERPSHVAPFEVSYQRTCQRFYVDGILFLTALAWNLHVIS